jgi:hypothetical protein
VITTALVRLQDPEVRAALRYVLDQGGDRSAVAALNALAELGDERDLGAMLRTARRKHWPLPAAATYAVARLTLRGALKPHLAKRALCDLGKSRDPYARANVAAALAKLGTGACEDGGPDPLRWLAQAKAPAVRVAAARWTHAALTSGRVDSAAALSALDECTRVDNDATVRSACVAVPGAKMTAPTMVQTHTRTADGDLSALPDRLVAVRLPDASVFIGYADRNGTLFLPDAPDGTIVLEDPAASLLEQP